MKIILDAMGGDNAPLEIIKGAVKAKKELKQDIVLVGDENIIKKTAEEHKLNVADFEIVHTEDVISMDDDPSSLITGEHKECSMAKGLKMLANDEGDAFISAGSTGALMVGGRFIVKNIKGIRRGALAPVLPSVTGNYMLIDSGANVECRADFLVKFAFMGSAYMSGIMGIKNPRVGLLNNGTEETKGTDLQKEAFELLKNAPINFVGNIEAREPWLGGCDVLVTDGFTGNIYLKPAEGMGKMVSAGLKKQLFKNPWRALGSVLLSGGLKAFKNSVDYKNYGGAPIMGLNKPVIKAHGSSDAKAIFSTIRQAVDYVNGDVTGKIKELIAQYKSDDGEENA